MDIRVANVDALSGLRIISLNGDLDGSNFQDVIASAQAAYADGATHILLDMENVPFMGSAGLVALHSTVLILKGEKLPDAADGWSAFHAVGDDIEAGMQPYLKILNPQPSIARGLKKTGMDQFIAIFTDREEAIASFME